ncbi:MAG: family 10 glycosylhydrolase [Eubacteriales bacterium]|nr:family 10 glycosylhydrolase [Eubacteriales bacterium]
MRYKVAVCLLLAIILSVFSIVPKIEAVDENNALTLLGATINPELGALRFGARYTSSRLLEDSSVVSMGILICPMDSLNNELAFMPDGNLESGIENLRAQGISNYLGKKGFSSYSYIDYYVTKSGITIDSVDTVFAVRAYLGYMLSGELYYTYSETITRSYKTVFEKSFPGEKIRVGEAADDYMKGIWISQYDMNALYVNNGVQREKSSYIALVRKMLQNIKHDGFNTVFLHMRPFGDSMYESQFFPVSLYVKGSSGTSISYDPIKIYIEEAKYAGISVHAWINPLRLQTVTEMNSVSDKYLTKQWYNAKNDRIVEVEGRLYLNPAYQEVIGLICNGAAEILDKYDVDGIHIDDYFYPTTSASFDSAAFAKSGYTSLSEFRENNINILVKSLYNTTHSTDKSAVFGVSPAGNLTYLRSTYFIDVAKWCSEDGFIDYILPQIYFGFLHGSCPFAETVDEWASLVTNPKVKYYVGLSGGNAFNAYNGVINAWAVTVEGKYEWINNKDVLKRSFEYIFESKWADGYCFFCYQYLYNPKTGEPTPNLAEEYSNFLPVVTSSTK